MVYNYLLTGRLFKLILHILHFIPLWNLSFPLLKSPHFCCNVNVIINVFMDIPRGLSWFPVMNIPVCSYLTRFTQSHAPFFKGLEEHVHLFFGAVLFGEKTGNISDSTLEAPTGKDLAHQLGRTSVICTRNPEINLL